MSLTNKVDINPAENPACNALINQGTSDYQRDKKSAENGFMRETWKTYLFSKEGIWYNIRDAIDLPYYKQLKVKAVGYKKVNISEYLKYLDEKWCKIDTNTRKRTKYAYYEKWIREEHKKVFGNRINNNKDNLYNSKIFITNEYKLRFYIDKIYNIKTFVKEDMEKWEKKT